MVFSWYNPGEKTRWMKVIQKGFKPFFDNYVTCEKCKEKVERMTGSWVSKCHFCKAIVSFFKATPIQEVAASSQNRVIFNVGGVGSGKTTISGSIFSHHMRTVPNARVLAAAQTMQQLKRFAIPELEKFIHPDEIAIKNQETWILKNGSSIDFVASDKPDKLRSANATGIWLVEAATPQMKKIYQQMMTRLRNTAAHVYELDINGNPKIVTYANGVSQPKILKDQAIMVIEANVTKGSWIKAAVLSCHTIFYTETVTGIDLLKRQTTLERTYDELNQIYKNANHMAILNASHDNPVLTPDYFQSIRASFNSEAAYEREIYCNLNSEDGLVFQQIIEQSKHIFQEIHDISREMSDPDWVFVETLDPGGSNETNDPSAYIFGIFNKKTKQLKLLDGFKQSGQSLMEDTQRMNSIRLRWGWNKLKHYVFTVDNAVTKAEKVSRTQNLKGQYELRLGTALIPCNEKGIKSGIDKVKYWFEEARAITVNRGPLEWLRSELFGYEYIEKESRIGGTDGTHTTLGFSETNNHGIDALRYLIVILESYGFHQDQHRIDFLRHEFSSQRLEQGGNGMRYEQNKINNALNSIINSRPVFKAKKIKF